jgi:hypothetical protein
MGVAGGYFLLAIVFCGWLLGLPAIVALIFGVLAFLESSKIDEFYAAEDYPSAEKASIDAAKLIKIGIIVAIVTLVLSVVTWVAWVGMSKIMGIFSRGTELPKD